MNLLKETYFGGFSSKLALKTRGEYGFCESSDVIIANPMILIYRKGF